MSRRTLSAPPAYFLALPFVRYSLDGLSASALASLCATNRTMRHATGDFVRVAARKHHGTASDELGLADLRALEQILDRLSIDLRRRNSGDTGQQAFARSPKGT